MPNRPQLTLLYHYFHPDDVISARLFSDIALGMTERGWDVVARPCHRGCRNEAETHPLRDDWAGGKIRRVWRPNVPQASNRGRLLNSAWMLGAWALGAAFGRRAKREAVIVGTDPVLSVLAAIPWRTFRPKSTIAHWCHDLYPEAPIAEGMVRADSRSIQFLTRLLRAAYRRCDLIADLGSCMAERLRAYGSKGRAVTLTPWALVEPAKPIEPDPATRADLFGDAKLGLLYSGNFGRAHSYTEFLELARALRGSPIGLCFAGRGNRIGELKAAVQPGDTNIGFAGFAPEAELEKRLGACDLHLVSLRPEWAGTVVPSKFFGALATGRGVVYAGPADSAIGRWVREHQVGYLLTSDTLPQVAAELRRLASNPGELISLRARCHRVYHEHFSKERVLGRWDDELRNSLRLN